MWMRWLICVFVVVCEKKFLEVHSVALKRFLLRLYTRKVHCVANKQIINRN